MTKRAETEDTFEILYMISFSRNVHPLLRKIAYFWAEITKNMQNKRDTASSHT